MSSILIDWNTTLVYAPIGIGIVFVAVHLVPYLLDPFNYRRPAIKGPWLNALSDTWLAYAAAQGNRSERVHELHNQYGKFVRIAPNHISIADSEALQVVYAHGNSTLKTEFYDAFSPIRRGLSMFSTRDRDEHARKQKIVSHVFSQQNVLAFESHIRRHVSEFCAQRDERCMLAAKGQVGVNWDARDGRAWFDCLPQYNYLAFDIIGHLAFGSPFGMITAQRDSAPMLEYVEGRSAGSAERIIKHVPAIKILNDRGDYAASLGVMPSWWHLWIKWVPWYARGDAAVRCLAGLAVAAVTKRLEEGLPDKGADEDWGFASKKKKTDLLERLSQAKDENGAPMGKEELAGEALSQLVAGSDSTSNSACAITYYLAANPEKQRKLQAELDEYLLAIAMSSPAIPFEKVKALPYLNACINEGLRLHATSSTGLPRVVPPGTVLEVCGEIFGPGSVLSVPSFTVHRDQAVWGEDVEVFRPERWFEVGTNVQVGVAAGSRAKAFNPFSYGPRACIGRSLAAMELQIIISSAFARYEFELLQTDEPLKTREGFLRRPLSCYVGIKHRKPKN